MSRGPSPRWGEVSPPQAASGLCLEPRLPGPLQGALRADPGRGTLLGLVPRESGVTGWGLSRGHEAAGLGGGFCLEK